MRKPFIFTSEEQVFDFPLALLDDDDVDDDMLTDVTLQALDLTLASSPSFSRTSSSSLLGTPGSFLNLCLVPPTAPWITLVPPDPGITNSCSQT